MIEEMRVVAYDVWGERRGVVPAVSEISTVRPLNDVPTGTLVVVVGGVNAEMLTLPVEIGIETKIKGSWIEQPGHRFLAVKKTGNRLSPDTYTLNLIGIAAVLRWATVWEASPESPDLKRVFKSVTPGEMLGALLTEVKARRDASGLEWAPGLGWDFTTEIDSAGTPWPRKARNEWNRSDDLGKVLSWLADKGAVDWITKKRVLCVYVAETEMGRRRDNTRLRGGFSTSLPVDESWEELATVARFAGDGGMLFERTNNGAVAGLGRIERWSEQGQVSNPATAAMYLDELLTPHRGPSVEYRREWVAGASPAQPYPFVDYGLGDWVPIDPYGEDTSLRVVEIQLKQDSAGQVTGAEALGTRLQSLAEKLARKTTDLSSGQVGGENGRPVAPASVTKPGGAVAGVTVSASQVLNNAGVLVGVLSVSWSPVAGNPACEVELDTGQGWVYVGTVKGNSGMFDCPPAGRVSVRVRTAATDDTQAGPWSGIATVNVEVGETATPRPTGLVLSSRMGVVYGGWDGKVLAPDGSVAGAPPSFQRLEVSVTEVENEPGVDSVPDNEVLSAPGVTVIEGRAIGSTVWVWARLVDLQGGVSGWTKCGQIRVTGVSGPDIEANAVTANSINVGSVTGAIGQFVQLTVGQVSGDAATFIKAVVDNLVANKAVLNTLWADIIYGRMISASMIIGGVIQADQLRLGGVDISPECLRGMGTIQNPVSYGGSTLDSSGIQTTSEIKGASASFGGGKMYVNPYGNLGAVRLESDRFVTSSSGGFHFSRDASGHHNLTMDGVGFSRSGNKVNLGGEGLQINGRLDVTRDAVVTGDFWCNKLTETSTRASKEYVEKVRDLTGLLDVEPVAYRAKATLDVWREQFGEPGPSRPLKPLPERQVGFIAEDLEAAGLGILVTHDLETKKPVGVEYSKLSVALWQIARAQRDQIAALEQRIEKIEKAVAA